jgi:predicted ArsR family transcriptional regulator
MTRPAQNEPELRKLARLLCRSALTASQIADRTDCSKMAAYKRLQALKKRGLTLTTVGVRGGDRGPKARAYKVAPTKALKTLLAKP